MIPDPDELKPPAPETPARLLRWRPEHGVLSLYIRVDPGDRSDGWHIEVRNGLNAVIKSAGHGDHEDSQALRHTVTRLEHELLDTERQGEHRGLIGFVEIAPQPGDEHWYATQVPTPRTQVSSGPVPHVHQLLELLDDGAPLGVAAVSSERVRLFDWRLGRLDQLHDWELEYFAGDWKERKAQRPSDPAMGEGVSSSGRDQYNQRLEANRERFALQTGRLAGTESTRRKWRQLLIFGDERYAAKFREGAGGGEELGHAGPEDLVSETNLLIERRIEEMLPGLNRAREKSLVDRIKDLAYSEARSSLGVAETIQALSEGRVEHLVYDQGREYTDAEFEWDGQGDSELQPIERMVELALASGAAITPVEGESAQALDEQGGVAALLRY